MPSHATFYCPDPAPLSADELRRLAADADIREERAGLLRRTQRLTVRWPDARVTFSRMDANEIPGHLAGFIGFVRATMPGDTFALEQRIRAVKQVIGGVIEPGPDAAGRSERLVAALAASRGALVFRDDRVLDETLQPALRPPPRPTPATMGEPRVLRELHLGGPGEPVPTLRITPFALEAVDAPQPPEAPRVLRRALVLAAVGLRGQLEAARQGGPGAAMRLLDGLERHDALAEVEPEERALLAAPVGALTPQQATDASWRAEGLAVLTWALGLAELPPHDVLAGEAELVLMRWLLADTLPASLTPPTLRTRDELAAMAKHLLGLHWRLVDFRVRPRALDLAAFARDCWFGSFDLRDTRLEGGDLAVGNAPISRAAPADVRRATSIAVERHRAINWLDGHATRYADVDVST